MKKISLILCLCLVFAMLFAACGGHGETPETSDPTTAHEHALTQWAYDLANHWYVCACGETVTEPHNPDNFDVCQVCGVAAYDNGDGTYTIMTYDEQGTMDSQTDYDAEGNVIFQLIHTTKYYEDGNPHHTWEYHDGVLLYEKIFLPCENPEHGVYLSEDIIYQDDTKIVSILDENWNTLSLTTYDAAGAKTSEETYEYEFDEYGNVLKATCHKDGQLAMVREAYMGPDGMLYESGTTYYEKGEVTNAIVYTHTFTDDGNLTYQATHINGIKFEEAFYEADDEGNYYLAHEISYNDEGEVVAEYFYTADGEQLLPTGTN